MKTDQNAYTKQAAQAPPLTPAIPLTQAKLQVFLGGHSNAGIKATNEDAFASLVPKDAELTAKGVVAVIADGVSSASKAAEAAQLSVTQFINDYYATPQTWSTQKSASKVLSSLNQWLYAQTDAVSGYTLQWLTTFSALIVKSSTAYIFHVGDTRISQYRQHELEVLTKDHQQKQGPSHSVLTRALGADHRLQVDVQQVAIQAGDIFVLTCDGVHEYLSAQQIKKQLNQLPQSPSTQALEQMAKLLTELAIKKGSKDNVSCLLVYIGGTPNRALVEIERELLNKAIPPALAVGNSIDDYEICKVIHASIRSHLYLAKHPNESEPCVLKVPSQNLADDSSYLQGFIREAWLGERLSNSHVMKIKRGSENSRFLYHICEYIDGQTLGQWMFDNPKPNLAQVRDIVGQIIIALRSFQRLEVIHRDLKPDNIMIDSYGKVFLIDYGTALIASLAENNDAVTETVPQGTLNYIAPETLLTLHADHQSDLFSLGVITYEMLCGELPYKPMQRADMHSYTVDDEKSRVENYSQWQYRSIRQFRSDLPFWLDMVLSKATQADPKFRLQAYSEFKADLSKPTASALEEYKSQPILQRNPVLFWQGATALFFILWLSTIFF
ncbi:bifunctional protein-serine/threonine kinase/phosphatase [Colwellia sp. Bg11-28]|uniref:bifunctional protein-serine/threonine kinase/phosphatase n=1 Tax=Colwellia sp. Bg11-28 TaxID=2058305 RepID=UPI000C31F476|nr:bifunctional protein-serine/threonine kinase/phosphatase [Colwellia sp. Bg11-28]PKH86029.1 protein kinase [Colwellia sp. Bg11-28]